MKEKRNTYADLVIKNARIHTVDLTIDEIREGKKDFTTIEKGYVAVKDGKIIAVESGEPCFDHPPIKVIDAQGKTLVPGFCDSHMHAQFAGEGLLNIDLRDVPSPDAMYGAVAERVKKTPAGKFIQGAYWNELLWDAPKIPTRRDLDKISTEHPMFFMRTCFHVACVNSLALKLAGIDKNTPDPDGGRIGRDGDGEPDGILYENAAMGLVQSVIPPLSEEEQIQAIAAIGGHLNQFGITTVIDANLSFNQMRAYLQSYKQGKLSYRANFMFYLDAAAGPVEYHLKRLDEMAAVTGFGNEMVRFNAVKVTLDGIPATGTACMRKPYEHIPETSGFTTITPEEMTEIAVKSAQYHWQLGVHTIGDKAVDIALAAFDEANNKYGPIQENRNYLIHIPFPHEDQVPLLKKLNVSVTLQPAITHLMGETNILSKDQATIMSPSGFFFKRGIICGGSTDHPVVPCTPFIGMYAAVTRLASDGKLWGPEYAVSAKEALIMWTKNSAYFSHEENVKGSIDLGYYGDLTLLDRDILSCPAEEIKDTKVLLTVLGGKVVYEA
jgi:predicted amidohydrolase YtcJ